MNLLRLPSIFVLFSCLLIISCEKDLENKIPVVDAGEDISITSPTSEVTLTGTAIDPDGKVVAHLWTKISGEGSPEVENPGALSTRVTGLTVGEYQFRFTAIDSFGGASADTVLVTVNPADRSVLTLQPSNNESEVHVFGSETIDQTDPNAPELLGGSGTYLGSLVNIRAMLKFDLASLPANVVIDSASLQLYSNHTPLNGIDGNANYGTNNALLIQRITSTWYKSTVSWQNQPSVTNEGELVVPQSNQAFADVAVDVTAMISQMLDEGSNNGFLIRLQSEEPYNFRIFCSSKYTDASRHPKLSVWYHVE